MKSEARYLVAEPRRSLQQGLPGVLVHDQPPGLRRDGTHGRGEVRRRGAPVQPRRLWWSSAVGLGLQGGRTERGGGGAGLERRAGIMIRRGVSLPRSAALLGQLEERVGEEHEELPRSRGATTRGRPHLQPTKTTSSHGLTL